MTNDELPDSIVSTEHGLISRNPGYMQKQKFDTTPSGNDIEVSTIDNLDTRILHVDMTTSTAHRLTEYDGVCNNVHGHNIRWVADIEIEMTDDKSQMVVDYKEISDVFDQYDHALVLNNKDSLCSAQASLGNVVAVPGNPTCEFLSKYVAEEVYNLYNDILDVEITMHETDKYATTGHYP